MSINFSSIVGQSKISAQLLQFLSSNRIPHAIMLDTKEGRGGLPLAIAFANALQCKNLTKSGVCGECDDCRKSSQMIHPDIHFSFPVVKADGKRRDESFSNDFLKQWRSQISEEPYFNIQSWLRRIEAEKSTANINVKECNEIVKKLSLKAFSGAYKVLILWLPEYLGKNGNRLLKLIEEPTDDTVIILITHDSSRILNTIHSRCQTMRIPTIEDSAIGSYLKEHYELDESEMLNAVRMSEGNLIAASELAAGFDNKLSDEVFQWLFRNYEFKIEEIAKWIDNFARETKEYQKQFLRFISYIIRPVLRSKLIGGSFEDIDETNRRDYERLAEILTLSKAESLLHITNQSIDEIDRNINVKIMMMTASLQVSKILREQEEVEIF